MKNFWKNKKVFITGHTGFKGSWLTLILSNLGAKVYGYALNPISKPNFFDGLNLKKFLEKDIRANIKDFKKLSNATKTIRPDIAIHMAAQSSVLVSYNNPDDTIKTNIIGTSNFLKSILECKSVKSALIITTDKVYLNLEKRRKFVENDLLGGYDIYSGSKAACEIITHSYIHSFFKKLKCNVATVRSGNCIGGGDWTKDRIIKDCAESFLFNKTIKLRSPKASRPWQHVMEPLYGYLLLAKKLFKNKINSFSSWNFGPNFQNNMKVIDVALFGKKYLNSKSKISITSQKYYESNHLSLNSKKAQKTLAWKTHLKPKDALKLSFDWYKSYYQNKNKDDLLKLSFNQIINYEKKFIKDKIK